MRSQAERGYSSLIEALKGEYGHLRISAIRHIGQGMDVMVYYAYSQELGQLAIKLPYSRWVSSGNETHLDTRMLLQQEAALSKHLRVSGLPTPEVFVLHTDDDDGVDFLIEEFIRSDDSTLSQPAFGHLIRSIHSIPVPAMNLVANKSAGSIDELLADRIEDRLIKLAEIVGLPDGIPDIGSALAADPTDGRSKSLLHMDLRPENILVRSCLAVAILDWSNALVGDPGLDLARAAEYGSLTAVALAAYGAGTSFRMIPEAPREIVYRLDTAVMLSHVFLNGAPDEAKARFYIDRTTNYCRALLLHRKRQAARARSIMIDYMHADAIIIGAGLVGAAAARALSRRGRAVVVLEAFEPGHTRGSSHGSARIFRRAYPDPFYVRLTGEAAQLWRQIQDEAGEQLITMTGAIDFGPGARPARLYEVMCALGIPAESLRPGQARERWHYIAFDDNDKIVYHPEAGALDAARATKTLCRLAGANGADIRYQTPALSIDRRTGSVVTDDNSFTAPAVIVAAGPWLGPLLHGHAELPELKVTQTQAFHFMAARAGAAGSSARWPAFIYHDGNPAAPSGVLSGADMPGAMKVGTLGIGNETTADQRDFRIDPLGRNTIVKFVRAKVPGLIPDPVGELSCLFTSTPTRNFILRKVERLVVVSACSGHGAKFVPLIGEIIADLVDGKPSPIERFAI